jgi:hypothetical protein
MSAFRKLALTFGAAALSLAPAFGQLPGFGLGADNVAAAAGANPLNLAPQDIRCDVSAQPLTVRVEGLAELLGDITITCTGNLLPNPRNASSFTTATYATPAAVMPTINVQVTTSVNNTSRFFDPLTEALIFVDDATTAVALPPASSDTRFQNPCANTAPAGVCTTFVHDGNTTLTAAGATTTVSGMSTTDPLVGAASSSADGRGAVLNVFQAGRLNNQTLVFTGVPLGFVDTRANPRLRAAYLAAAAASPGGVYDGRQINVRVSKTYRIKNLRGAIAGNASINSQIFAYVAIQNPAGTLQVNSASAVVGQVNPGLAFARRSQSNGGFDAPLYPLNVAACVTFNRDLATDPTDGDPYSGGVMNGRFTEGYAVAFRTRGFAPGQTFAADQTLIDFNYNTESGYYNRQFPAVLGLNEAGIADHGTRLRMVFTNIPANVRLYTSTRPVSQGTSASIGAYAVVADASGGNPAPITVPSAPTSTPAALSTTLPVFPGAVSLSTGGAGIPALSFVLTGTGAQGLINMQITSGTAVQTWEVFASDSLITEQISFPAILAFRAANAPGLGTVSVNGTFAPINTTATGGGRLTPIPRFVETGTPATAFLISPCITNLLFPFITNQAGFNTGIAISNTSLTNPGTGELFALDNNFGVAPQQGTCTLNYFGTTGADGAAPPPATTGVIPAGRTFVMTLASGSSGPFGTVPAAQNFQGYMIAQCNFRYAHGYAFISDLGAVQLAQGYIALVMDAALGSRTGVASEVLGH